MSENVFDIPLKVETLPTSFGSTSHFSFLNFCGWCWSGAECIDNESCFFGDYDVFVVCGACVKKLAMNHWIRQFESFVYGHVNSVDEGKIFLTTLSLPRKNRTQSGERAKKFRKFGISKNRNRNEMEAVCQFNSLGLSPSIRGTNAWENILSQILTLTHTHTQTDQLKQRGYNRARCVLEAGPVRLAKGTS